MEGTEVRKLAELEDRHWWYRERRVLLARELARIERAGTALDIGAAGGGNTRVLRSHGWTPIAIEYGAEGAEVARDRGLNVLRADARQLPVADNSIDLVVAFDVLEHITEDDAAMAEIGRVTRPGGVALIAVPCDMRLWSAHDEAVGHVRRYTRDSLQAVITGGGFRIESLKSWNVLLRPAAAWHRKRSTGSDLDEVPPLTNRALSAVIAAERYLPVQALPGVSLLVRARRA
ncbi:class I SAM-dependent methyltransferase [Kitasatospora sp. NBC_01287]|uniref:class I SAM-dependent methyltransferase n=1 Tax=Kitasatospora sp. NBC_01287 TaxID=2903573 RepID=UPI00224F6152|nr:class I SAM-dependent methyltransferase [Kitasatospora sp. NBC_01287]MCX4749086.1 class I SAM-dependent methyltransferase [Kitasatospora sp. NBC_01287]